MVQGEVMLLSTNKLNFQLSSNSALENIHKNYLGLHQSSSFALSRLLGRWMWGPGTEWVEMCTEKSASVKQHKLKQQRSFLQGRTGVCCRTRSETWNLFILPFVFSLTFLFQGVSSSHLSCTGNVSNDLTSRPTVWLAFVFLYYDNCKKCVYKCISAQGWVCQRKADGLWMHL